MIVDLGMSLYVPVYDLKLHQYVRVQSTLPHTNSFPGISGDELVSVLMGWG